jgi:hypothetical protein
MNQTMERLTDETVSEISSTTPLTLPPIEPHSHPSRNSPGEHNGHLFSQASPMSATFGSTTSLHSTPPGNHYSSHNGDGVLPTPSPSASRRSSFDSRLGNLQLSSPISGTPAGSQISLNSTLLNNGGNRDSLASQMQRERGIQSNSPVPSLHPPPPPGSSHSHEHNPSPSHNTFSYRSNDNGPPRTHATPARTAPPIVGSSRYPYGQASHPNAPSPTKGLPWAFPDPDIALNEARRDSSHGRNSSTSLPGSNTSGSIYSSNSGVTRPSIPSLIGLNGAGSGQTLPQIGQGTHHHGLTHRRPSIVGDGSHHTTPYSRTPELRVSHKLAERKRRKEMKELFDELRDSLPAERGGKSSKWEVLTKGRWFFKAWISFICQDLCLFCLAIEFVNHQKDSLTDKSRTIEDMRAQILQYQKDLDIARAEAQHCRHQSMQSQGGYHHQSGPSSSHAQLNGHNDGYHSQSSSNHGPGRMQGLEPC